MKRLDTEYIFVGKNCLSFKDLFQDEKRYILRQFSHDSIGRLTTALSKMVSQCIKCFYHIQLDNDPLIYLFFLEKNKCYCFNSMDR